MDFNYELRGESVHIEGYVNAVERLSKPITEKRGGKTRTFREKIRAGAFEKALSNNDNVLFLLNHQSDRQLGGTKDNKEALIEDSIGLRACVDIDDKEVVQKARDGKLSGWSFGFYCDGEETDNDAEGEIRTVTDMRLVEVSILDSDHIPAYDGTLIEARDEDCDNVEIRTTVEEIKQDAEMKHQEVEMKAEMDIQAIIENAIREHERIDAEKEQAKFDLIVETVISKLNATREQRETIDYSSLEERLNKIKKDITK